jgi:hypothetical protein
VIDIEELETFLDSGCRGNSKTFYYLRIFAHHNIPLIVHSEQYAWDLKREYWNKLGSVASPKIISISNDRELRLIRQKLICDNMNVKHHRNFYMSKWYTDNEIRNIVLTDMAEGRSWFYDEWNPVKRLK